MKTEQELRTLIEKLEGELINRAMNAAENPDCDTTEVRSVGQVLAVLKWVIGDKENLLWLPSTWYG